MLITLLPPSPRQNGLASALKADGSLKAGILGSFDASGYRMELSAGGAHHFVAASKRSQWDTQFTLPNGLSDEVFVLLVSGTDIYVGGNFTAGDVNANPVAKFDTMTNTWSALGTGGGNGVSNFVSDLKAISSDLYAGGQFGAAGDSKASVGIGRFNKRKKIRPRQTQF